MDLNWLKDWSIEVMFANIACSGFTVIQDEVHWMNAEEVSIKPAF